MSFVQAPVYVLTWNNVHSIGVSASNNNTHICLQDIFETPCTVDAAYRYYCDVNAAKVYDNSTSPMLRSLQVQERTYALAGLMARRYSSVAENPALFFEKNMQTTAQRNTDPVSLNNAIKMLSQLDLRRGSGTYSDFIRIPSESTQKQPPRPYTDFLPQYDDTWFEFLEAVANNELHLPTIPII